MLMLNEVVFGPRHHGPMLLASKEIAFANGYNASKRYTRWPARTYIFM